MIKNIWYIHNQGIYIEITALTPATFSIPMGYVPRLSLACVPNPKLVVPWMNQCIYIIMGRKNQSYVHNRCKYFFTLSFLPHPPNDVCGVFMEFNVMYIIKLYTYSLYQLSQCTPLKMMCAIIREANNMSCT